MISIEPLMVNDEDAAKLLGISTSTLRKLGNAGTLPKPRQIGGSARYLVRELRDAAEAARVSELLPPPRKRSNPDGEQ